MVENAVSVYYWMCVCERERCVHGIVINWLSDEYNYVYTGNMYIDLQL